MGQIETCLQNNRNPKIKQKIKCEIKMHYKSNIRKKRLMWTHAWFLDTYNHGTNSMVSEEEGRDECWHSPNFIIFYSAQTYSAYIYYVPFQYRSHNLETPP